MSKDLIRSSFAKTGLALLCVVIAGTMSGANAQVSNSKDAAKSASQSVIWEQGETYDPSAGWSTFDWEDEAEYLYSYDQPYDDWSGIDCYALSKECGTSDWEMCMYYPDFEPEYGDCETILNGAPSIDYSQYDDPWQTHIP